MQVLYLHQFLLFCLLHHHQTWDYKHVIHHAWIFLFFFIEFRDQTWVLMLAKQAFYRLSYFQSFQTSICRRDRTALHIFLFLNIFNHTEYYKLLRFLLLYMELQDQAMYSCPRCSLLGHQICSIKIRRNKCTVSQ